MGRNGKMTAGEATTFTRISLNNAAILAAAAEKRGCTCEPYRDWYTFRRWLAQGRAVCKGEHGVKLGTIIEEVTEERDGTRTVRTRPWTATVFCRHQTKEARR